MKAVILAGGKGTRLAPYTTVFPKPLVPLGNRPIIDIIIRQLAAHGFRDIILNVGYLAELIQAYFQNSTLPSGIRLSYVKEENPTGTAGSIGLTPGLKDTFLVMNGDILTTMNYAALIDYHKQKGGILTIGMHRKKVKMDLGVIETGEGGLITGYLEKPEHSYNVSMGIYVYEPAVLNYIRPGVYLDFPDLVKTLIKAGERVVGYTSEDYWLDIGRHDDYAQAQQEFELMKDKLCPDPEGHRS